MTLGEGRHWTTLAPTPASGPFVGRHHIQTAVYHPPKSGMPYLVVTVAPEGVTATACESKDKARILASKKTMAVFVEEAVPIKP